MQHVMVKTVRLGKLGVGTPPPTALLELVPTLVIIPKTSNIFLEDGWRQGFGPNLHESGFGLRGDTASV